eukprot:1176702-Prorocentrum_minimum.AAC.6
MIEQTLRALPYFYGLCLNLSACELFTDISALLAPTRNKEGTLVQDSRYASHSKAMSSVRRLQISKLRGVCLTDFANDAGPLSGCEELGGHGAVWTGRLSA